MLEVALGLVEVVDVVVAAEPSAAVEAVVERLAAGGAVVEPFSADVGLREVSAVGGEEAEDGFEFSWRLSSHRSKCRVHNFMGLFDAACGSMLYALSCLQYMMIMW